MWLVFCGSYGRKSSYSRYYGFGHNTALYSQFLQFRSFGKKNLSVAHYFRPLNCPQHGYCWCRTEIVTTPTKIWSNSCVSGFFWHRASVLKSDLYAQISSLANAILHWRNVQAQVRNLANASANASLNRICEQAYLHLPCRNDLTHTGDQFRRKKLSCYLSWKLSWKLSWASLH